MWPAAFTVYGGSQLAFAAAAGRFAGAAGGAVVTGGATRGAPVLIGVGLGADGVGATATEGAEAAGVTDGTTTDGAGAEGAGVAEDGIETGDASVTDGAGGGADALVVTTFPRATAPPASTSAPARASHHLPGLATREALLEDDIGPLESCVSSTRSSAIGMAPPSIAGEGAPGIDGSDARPRGIPPFGSLPRSSDGEDSGIS